MSFWKVMFYAQLVVGRWTLDMAATGVMVAVTCAVRRRRLLWRVEKLPPGKSGAANPKGPEEPKEPENPEGPEEPADDT